MHEHWGDNVFLETFVDVDIETALDAPIKVTREISHRAPVHGAARRPRRGRASWTIGSSSSPSIPAAQMPHIVRTGLAECLGLDHGQIRVISPDVGGGFGYKGILLPEEVAWPGSRCASAIRCAGSRTAASI